MIRPLGLGPGVEQVLVRRQEFAERRRQHLAQDIARPDDTLLVEVMSIVGQGAERSVMGRHEIDPEFAPERSVNPVPRRLASTAKAERLLGFQAAIPLEGGLRELVDWWRAERQRSAAPTVLQAAAS